MPHVVVGIVFVPGGIIGIGKADATIESGSSAVVEERDRIVDVVRSCVSRVQQYAGVSDLSRLDFRLQRVVTRPAFVGAAVHAR